MTAFPTYELGTVSVANGGITVSGDGAIWSGVNARAGDSISIDGGPFTKIGEVTDDTHLELVLPSTGDKANVPYVIIWDSPLRYVGGQVMVDVSDLIAKLRTNGLLWYLPDGYDEPGDVTPPLTADEGQGILKIDTGALWVMQGASWVAAGTYKGFNYKGPYNPVTAYVTNDVLTSGGSVYLVTAPTTGNAPPNASYYDVFASKGDTGAKGDTGDDATIAVGTVTGVAYGQPATVTNVGTPGAAIFDFEIPKGQDGTGIGDLLSTNNLSDLANADTALDNLGGTTVGKLLFTATDAAAARKNINVRDLGFDGTIVESHSSNAVTFTVKTASGNTPSGSDQVRFTFPDGAGGFTDIYVTAALSITISSGSTLGIANATSFRVAIVALNDAGTVVLGAGNLAVPPESSYLTFSSTAEGGAGAADSTNTIYTASAVSSKYLVPVGLANYNSGLTTAGTWASSPTSISAFTNRFAALPYDLTFRPDIVAYPVAVLRSKTANQVGVLDLMPNGTASASPEGLISWFDVCDADLIKTPSTATHCARIGVDSSGNMRLQAISYNGAGNGDMYFYAGGANRLTLFALNGGLVPTADNTSNCGYTTNRWTAVYAVTGTIQTSDLNQKKDIEPTKLGLDYVLSLRPVTYRWKEGEDKEAHQGVIAQEVLASANGEPCGVIQGETLGLNYAELIGPLIKAVQELSAKVEALDALP